MRTELQVVVQQTPGNVSWNFDQLKANIMAVTETYRNMVYTDESIPAARTDVANLRKLRAAVEEHRQEIRRTCLQPYAAIEAQAKELTSLIDAPINSISGQIKDYENQRKAEKRTLIQDYMGKSFSTLPKPIADRLMRTRYDPRWENASTPKKTWTEAIDAIRKSTEAELIILDGVESDFRDTAIAEYQRSLSLANALQIVKQMRSQREILLQQQTRATVEVPSTTTSKEGTAPRTPKEQTPYPAKSEPGQAIPGKETDMQGARAVTLRITGTQQQINRICAFIRYAGADYQEVQP